MPESFTNRDQKVVVRYLKGQNTPSDEIHKLLTAAAGPTAVSYKEVRQWVQDIVEGKEDKDMCTCSAGSGNGGNSEKASPTDPALICRIENLVNFDRRITTDKAGELSSVSDFVANQILTNVLSLRRVCERWIPRTWTPDQRTYRVSVCKELNDFYNYGGTDFLPHLIVGDECFACYHMTDGGAGRRPSRVDGGGDKYRPQKEPLLVNCSLFYDVKGLLVSELAPEGHVPSANSYVETIRNTLIPILKRKRGYTDGKPIYLLHDNTSIHNSLVFEEVQKELNIHLIPHPTNSPDMEPYEYWFFKQLKKMIGHTNFKSRADLWTALSHHAATLPETDYANSINQLPDRWNKIIDNEGLYILN